MTGAKAAEPYNLGVALGLTGAGALYSADQVEGIKLAVEEINAKGGFLGQHKVELFIRDTQTKPDVGVREVKDLILRDKIRAVINDYSSAVAMAVKPIAQEYKVLHIASISNSENITMINPSPYTFQVVPNSYMQAKAAAVAIAKMANQKGWKEYITIASDYEWGRSTQAEAGQIPERDGAESHAEEGVLAPPRRDAVHLLHHRHHGHEARFRSSASWHPMITSPGWNRQRHTVSSTRSPIPAR